MPREFDFFFHFLNVARNLTCIYQRENPTEFRGHNLQINMHMLTLLGAQSNATAVVAYLQAQHLKKKKFKKLKGYP